MKTKKLHLLAGITLLSFASCSNDMQELSIEQPQALKQIVMITEDFVPEAGSRTLYDIADGAVKCTWAANDTVGVFPDEGFQVAFPMTSEAGSNSATFTGGGWALKPSTVYMAYYPMQGKFYLDKENIPVKYSGQIVNENASTAHLGKYDYMVASATTPDLGMVNFQFRHLGPLRQLTVRVGESSTIAYVDLLTDDTEFIETGHIDLTAATPSIKSTNKVKSFRIYLNHIAVQADEDLVVYFLMSPVDLTDKTLKVVIHKENGYYQEIPLTGKNFEAGKSYELNTTMASEEEKPTTINVETAGTFETIILREYGSKSVELTSLKVAGELNGTDIRFIRKMAGRKEDGSTYSGKLNHLDLSDANIVAGGDYYIKYNDTEYSTENNIAGDYMFFQCNLKTIKFPLTVTKLGKEICSHLYISDNHKGTFTRITIPNGVEIIGDNAFANNRNLASIEIPDGVKEIGGNIIYRCDALTTINIPNSVEKMSCAFYYARGLQYVHLPENSKYNKIISSTFYGCEALQSLTIPANITEIDWYAIQNSALKEFHFQSKTPPYMSSMMSGQYGFPKNCKIYVPQGSYNAYKSNSSFKDYTIIEE